MNQETQNPNQASLNTQVSTENAMQQPQVSSAPNNPTLAFVHTQSSSQEKTGFVLSIVCVVLDVFTVLVGAIAIINLVLGFVTLIFGLIARKKSKTGKSLATVIVGIITIILGIIGAYI